MTPAATPACSTFDVRFLNRVSCSRSNASSSVNVIIRPAMATPRVRARLPTSSRRFAVRDADAAKPGVDADVHADAATCLSGGAFERALDRRIDHELDLTPGDLDADLHRLPDP